MKNNNTAPEGANVPNEHSELIKIILEEQKSVKKGKEVKSEFPTAFKSEDFFLDNNPHGLMYKSTFKTLLTLFKERDIQELHLFLQRLNENEKIEYSPVPFGTGEIKKIYTSLNGWRGKEQLTIPAVDNVAKFLLFYIQRRFSCDFSLKEIYQLVQD